VVASLKWVKRCVASKCAASETLQTRGSAISAHAAQSGVSEVRCLNALDCEILR